MTLTYLADASDSGKTLFTILRYRLRMSASLIRHCKFSTTMYVNQEPSHTDRRICPGDQISITLPEETADFPAEPGSLRILYEDEAIIALHKPAGIIIHPSATRNTGTLANQLLAYLGSGTVHCLNRLDRDTTGVTVFAKNSYIKSILTDALQKGQIYKTYLAPAYGSLPEQHGFLDYPIDRVGESSLWRTIREDGQPSRTEYQLLEAHGSWQLYAYHPLTGRTHQIRLHSLTAGAPLLGDPHYCTEASRSYSDSLGLSCQQLCCTEMSFAHPLSGNRISITTTPDFFQTAWFHT